MRGRVGSERVALAVLVVFVLGGAGLVLSDRVQQYRGGSDPDAALVLGQSIRRTADRASMSYVIDLEVTEPAGVRSVNVAAVSDTAAARSQGTVRLSHPDRFERTLAFAVVGRRLFLEGDDAWSEVDLLATLSETTDDEVSLLGLAVQRPLEFISMLQGVADAERRGRDVIDGIESNRFGARVNFEAALAQPGRFADPGLLELVTRRIDGSDLELDAWVDDNGKLRRLSFGGTLDGGRAYRFSLQVGRYGDDLPVTLPPDTRAALPLDLRTLLAVP